MLYRALRVLNLASNKLSDSETKVFTPPLWVSDTHGPAPPHGGLRGVARLPLGPWSEVVAVPNPIPGQVLMKGIREARSLQELVLTPTP